jgi:hypothetical protein
MSTSARIFFLCVFLLLSLIYDAEVIYHSRHASLLRTEWKSKIWVLGILSCIGFTGFWSLIWLPYFVPWLEQYTTLACAIVAIGLFASVAHRYMLRQVLHTPFDE